LNTLAFPRSANAFDSLADGLLAAGDSAGAVEAYRRVLALVPDDATISAETRAAIVRNATLFLERVAARVTPPARP